MLRRLIPAFLSALVTLLYLSSCSGKIECSDPLGCIVLDENDQIVVASAFPLTGELQSQGNAAFEAVKRAAKEQEYLLGHTIYVIKENLDCETGDNQEVAARLAGNDDIGAVFSQSCSTGDPQFIKSLADAGHLHLILTENPAEFVDDGSVIYFFSPANPQAGEQSNAAAFIGAVAYDSARMLFSAIEEVGLGGYGKKVVIPRHALYQAILSIQSYAGQAGNWTCRSEAGCKMVTENQ